MTVASLTTAPLMVPPAQPMAAPMPAPLAGPTAAPVPGLAAPRRVTVVTATARLDIALPPQCTIAELVPMLVWMTGAAAGAGPTGYAWSLRRLGAPAIPPPATVAAAGIRDGEVLHLTCTEPAGATVVFDDVVDAVASAVQERRGRWTSAVSRRVGLGAAVVAFAAAALLTAWAQPLATAGLAVLLLAAGSLLARGRGDTGLGAAIAAAGLPGAFAAGAALLSPPDGITLGTPQAALGFAAAAGYGMLAGFLTADRSGLFTAAVGAAGVGAATAVAALAAGLRPESTVAVALALSIAASPIFPWLALRLARLPLPRIPADIAAFRAGEQPTSGPQAAAGAQVAEAALTGLLAALAVVLSGCALVLLRTGDPWAWALAGLCGPAMLLRSRAYVSVGQRCAVLLGAGVALLGTAARLGGTGDQRVQVALLAAALAAGIGGTVHAFGIAGRTPSPYWTRLLDVLEFVSLAALVPLALNVAGVYATLRGLGG